MEPVPASRHAMGAASMSTAFMAGNAKCDVATLSTVLTKSRQSINIAA